MSMPLLYIQPRTLNFAVDLKKQSSCVVQLTNQFVAFKVKTTSPEKHCVRPNVGVQRTPSWMKSFQKRRRNQRIIAFALDTSSGDDTSGLGSTRLGRIAIAGGKLLLLKLNSARQNFPMKIFLLLLGFYTANALATILGQTGDWDVLVAGIVVAAIEGIGMLMYKKKKKPSSSIFSAKFQSFIVLMNFWKAGVCLGLFVDAFKLGS